MICLYRMAYQDKQDNGCRVDKFLFGLPTREWSSDVCYRLFASVPSVNYFRHLINSIVFETSIMALGRCELYLAVPPPIYIVSNIIEIFTKYLTMAIVYYTILLQHLTCNNEAGYMQYRSTSMLFQMMFKHEFIARIPRKYFLPYQTKYRVSKTSKLAKVIITTKKGI